MLLTKLAEKILDLRFDDLPDLAVATAKEAIFDTVGCTLAGAPDDTTATVARALRPMLAPGPALLIGTSERIDILNAAQINGTACHALDFDDCSNTMGGHPSAPVIPALWALADQRQNADGKGDEDKRRVGGEAFIAAYIAGFECETRLGRAVNFHHYDKGWHPTSTLGTFGAAAACGHLMGLDRDRLATALSIAASMASGIKANFGTMTKPFHVGQAARNGLLAALLAEAGMTANPAALEHHQGFLAVFNGAGNFDADLLLDGWADPLDILENGIAFKRHPCCASTHPAVDALLTLRERHGLTPDNVAKIESWTHPRRFKHTNRADPTSGLDAKFSVQYALARALAEGIVSSRAFTDTEARDPATRAVMSRVTSAPDPEAVMETREHFYAKVRVTTTDGESHEAFVDRALGRDRDHALPQGALEAKFLDCATRSLAPAAAGEVLERILGLNREPDVAALSETMAQGAKARAGAVSTAGAA